MLTKGTGRWAVSPDQPPLIRNWYSSITGKPWKSFVIGDVLLIGTVAEKGV